MAHRGCSGWRCPGFLFAEASLVSGRRLQSIQPSGVVAHGLDNCGSQAQLLHGTWDLSGPGIEPLNWPGRFSSTVPPGKVRREPFLRSLLNLCQYCVCPMYWFSGHQTCGSLAPRPGVELSPPAAEGRSLNLWTTREVPVNILNSHSPSLKSSDSLDPPPSPFVYKPCPE